MLTFTFFFYVHEINAALYPYVRQKTGKQVGANEQVVVISTFITGPPTGLSLNKKEMYSMGRSQWLSTPPPQAMRLLVSPL
jgi:hypothetical protein